MAEGAVDSSGAADAARRAAEDAARRASEQAARTQQAQQTQQTQQQQQQQAALKSSDVNATVNQVDSVGTEQRRVDAARAAGNDTAAVVKQTDPALPTGQERPLGSVTDDILKNRVSAAPANNVAAAASAPTKTGIDKAADDIRRVSPAVAGDPGKITTPMYEGHVAEAKSGIEQQLARVRGGADLQVPAGGTGLKEVKLDDQARAALTSRDQPTRDAAVDRLARAVADSKDFQTKFNNKNSYSNVGGKTQQEHLEQLAKPDATTAEKKASLDALAQFTPFGRSGDAQAALDAAAKTGNGRPTDPQTAAAWDQLSKTDPSKLSQNDLRIANALLDKHPPMGGASQEPGNPARDLHDKTEAFRQAQRDVDDVHKRAGFSDDSPVVGTGADASKALVDDVQKRVGTASPADAARASAAVDRLQQDPATALPKEQAEALKKQFDDRQKTAAGADVKAKLDQAFEKTLGEQGVVGGAFDSVKNTLGVSTGSDAVRQSLQKLDTARKALDGSEEKKKNFDAAAADTKKSIDAYAKSQDSLSTRGQGLLQAATGLLEAAVGVATAETGVGVLVAAHGVDQAQAGIRQAITGEETKTETQKALSSGLQKVGVDKGTAEFVASLGDTALSFAGPAAAAKIATAQAARLDAAAARAASERPPSVVANDKPPVVDKPPVLPPKPGVQNEIPADWASRPGAKELMERMSLDGANGAKPLEGEHAARLGSVLPDGGKGITRPLGTGETGADALVPGLGRTQMKGPLSETALTKGNPVDRLAGPSEKLYREGRQGADALSVDMKGLNAEQRGQVVDRVNKAYADATKAYEQKLASWQKDPSSIIGGTRDRPSPPPVPFFFY